MQISQTSLKYIWLKLNHFQVEECQGDQTEPGEKQVQKNSFQRKFSEILFLFFCRFLEVVSIAAAGATNQN